MSIAIEVPLDALRGNAAVAYALSELVAALAEHEGGAPAPAKRSRSARAVRTEVPAEPIAFDRERYDAFVKSLPERSQEFLSLVESRGKVSIDEAMQALELTERKALGGIMGSISRWAPVRGVRIPIEAKKTRDGDRIWSWVA
jgi:hypothetical protein